MLVRLHCVGAQCQGVGAPKSGPVENGGGSSLVSALEHAAKENEARMSAGVVRRSPNPRMPELVGAGGLALFFMGIRLNR